MRAPSGRLKVGTASPVRAFTALMLMRSRASSSPRAVEEGTSITEKPPLKLFASRVRGAPARNIPPFSVRAVQPLSSRSVPSPICTQFSSKMRAPQVKSRLMPMEKSFIASGEKAFTERRA